MTLFLLASLAATAAQPASPPKSAIVINWSGSPTCSDGKTSRPLKMYDRLRPGETVSAGPKGSVTLYFPGDGHKEVLHADASVLIQEANGKATGTVDVIGPKIQKENQEALREAIGAGKIGGAVVRGEKLGDLDPNIAPVNETIVVTNQPMLHWPAVKEAEGYRVTLQLAGSGKTLWTREVASTELKYPKDEKALARTMKYKWSVIAILANKVEKLHLKESTFTVGNETMEKQAEVWKELANSADPADQMLAAIGLEHLGILDEMYPLYGKITKRVTNDAKLWVIYATYAAKAGLQKESDIAYENAKKLGWKQEP
jgi:hypothetical protein